LTCSPFRKLLFGVDIVVAEGKCDVGDIVIYGVVVYGVAIDDEVVDGAGLQSESGSEDGRK
jgi:hypothetical protein